MKQTTLFLAKYILLFGMGVLVLLGIGIVVLYQSNIPQQTIKHLAEKELSKTLHQRVSIGYISGNLVTSTTLHDIIFYNHPKLEKGIVLHIGSLTAYYHLWDGIRFKGDFAKASDLVIVSDVTLYAKRNIQDLWNVLMILPPPNPNNPPPTFKGKILVRNLSVLFKDEHGWGHKTSDFSSQFSHISGLLDFSNYKKVPFYFMGYCEKKKSSPIRILGAFNAKNGRYALKIACKNLPLKKWGAYVMPIRGYQFYQGNASLIAHLRSKSSTKNHQLPFWTSVSIQLSGASLQVPFFKKPLKQGTARVTIHSSPQHPSLYITVSKGKARIQSLPVYMVGWFNLNTDRFCIRGSSQAPAYQLAQTFFNVKSPPIKDPIHAYLYVKGSFDNPIITGELVGDSVRTTLGIFKACRVSFGYQKPWIRFALRQAIGHALYLNGNGTIDTSSSPLSFEATLHTKPQYLSVLFPSLSKHVSGKIASSTKLKGNLDAAHICVSLEGEHATIYQQKLDYAQINLLFSYNNPLHIYPSKLVLNQGNPLSFLGTLTSEKNLSLSFEGNQVSTFPKGTVSLKGHTSNGHTVLESLHAEAHHQKINCHGEFDHLSPVFLDIQMENVDLSNPTIQVFLPKNRLSQGLISGQCHIEKTQDISPTDKQTTLPNWLHHYAISGRGIIINGQFLQQPIQYLSIQGSWKNLTLTLEDVIVKNASSYIALSGQLYSDQSLDLSFKKKSFISLGDFNVWGSRFGYMEGQLFLSGDLKGSLANPLIHMSIDAENIQSQFTHFNHMTGIISYEKNKIYANPLILKKGLDAYTLRGNIDIKNILHNPHFRLSDIDYQLQLSIHHVNLQALSSLMESIIKEVRIRIRNSEQMLPPSQIPRKNIEIVLNNSSDPIIKNPYFSHTPAPLYLLDSPNQADMSFRMHLQEFSTQEKPVDLGLSQWAEGLFTGDVTIQSRGEKFPFINGDIELEKFKSWVLKSKKASLSFHSTDQNVVMALKLHDGQLGNKAFSYFSLNSRIDNANVWTCLSSQLKTEKRSNDNILRGSIFLGRKDSSPEESIIDLHISLENNDIGLLSCLSPVIQDISNSGQVQLKIVGSLSKPSISIEKITLKDTKLIFSPEFTPFESVFVLEDAKISMTNNHLDIDHMNWAWSGKDTMGYHRETPHKNQLSLSGSIDINNLSFSDLQSTLLAINITSKPTLISLNLPKIYSGTAHLSACQLKGTYAIPFSNTEKEKEALRYRQNTETGPLLSGSIVLRSGEIIIPAAGEKRPRPSILLNLTCLLQDDLAIRGNLLTEELFNSFELALLPSTDPLEIKGSWNYPKIKNSLFFKEGTLHLFSRSFTLLEANKQRHYFADRPYNTKKNKLSFSLQEIPGQIKNIPLLDIAALAVIDPEKDSTLLSSVDPEASKYKHIVVSISGSVYTMSSFVFDKYLSDQNDNNNPSITFVTTAGLQNDDPQNLSKIAEMLIPDMYSNHQRYKPIDSTRLLNQMSENQLNALLRNQIRPIEKQLARNIGLYDLRIDYNVGGSLLKATNIQGLGNNDSNLGINLVQSLISDKLFIRARTSLDTRNQQKQSQKFQLSEVELTYLLGAHLSFNFSNIKDDTNTERRKLSLKYSYEF